MQSGAVQICQQEANSKIVAYCALIHRRPTAIWKEEAVNHSRGKTLAQIIKIKGCLPSDLLKWLDRGLSGLGRRLSINLRSDRDHHRLPSPSSPSTSYHFVSADADSGDDSLGNSGPPGWALLLIGCLLGVATGLCVAAFNCGVHVIHEWAWAGTPNEGAAWLRLLRLADTWHRILLIPVLGGVIVGVLHGLLEILDQIMQSTSSQEQGFKVFAAIVPIVMAIQAAITLGTGCSLGPEGPSVDIGKSCANGFSVTLENNRERRIALIAAGAAAGIATVEGWMRNLLPGNSTVLSTTATQPLF